MERKLNTIAFCVIIILVAVAWQQNPVPKVVMDRGKKVYDRTCLSCHMDNAMGVPRMNPSLVKSKLLLSTKTKPIRIILRGSDELQNEEGRNFKNIMAPMDSLSDQQIADVLTFVRNSFGNKASLITPGDVKYVRTRVK